MDERLWLSFGDVVSLSGDYFLPGDSWSTSLRHEGVPGHSYPPSSLFELARLPGDRGSRLGTRDEIVCALKVSMVDERPSIPGSSPMASSQPSGSVRARTALT
jgi:hypothetical protein